MTTTSHANVVDDIDDDDDADAYDKLQCNGNNHKW